MQHEEFFRGDEAVSENRSRLLDALAKLALVDLHARLTLIG
jgi:hypothetical protein